MIRLGVPAAWLITFPRLPNSAPRQRRILSVAGSRERAHHEEMNEEIDVRVRLRGRSALFVAIAIGLLLAVAGGVPAKRLYDALTSSAAANLQPRGENGP